MRLVQLVTEGGQRAVGITEADGRHATLLREPATVYDLALAAIEAKQSLEAIVTARLGHQSVSLGKAEDEGRLLAPIDHPDPAHVLVSGTGLTHLGSAATRAGMHQKLAGAAEAELTDSMKMFRQGLEGGRPAAGAVGVQPEWFYKGDGSILARPGGDLAMPDFALDGGEEPEVVGLYLIGPDGQPWRVGFALGNEFSDHVTERQNYLLLAHSKLRACSFGPELLLGTLPADIRGTSRIWHGQEVIWEKEFLSGEANMSHTLANLEHHHFKYAQMRRPGDLHVHYFGAATLSFADGIKAAEGDVFEIEASAFGRPLRNRLSRSAPVAIPVQAL